MLTVELRAAPSDAAGQAIAAPGKPLAPNGKIELYSAEGESLIPPSWDQELVPRREICGAFELKSPAMQAAFEPKSPVKGASAVSKSRRQCGQFGRVWR